MGFGKITSPFRSGGGWPSTERKDASVLQYCGGGGLPRRVERERLRNRCCGLLNRSALITTSAGGPGVALTCQFGLHSGFHWVKEGVSPEGPIDTHTPTLPTVSKMTSKATERGPKSPQKAMKWISKNLVTPKQTFGGRSKASRSSNRCIACCCLRLDWT